MAGKELTNKRGGEKGHQSDIQSSVRGKLGGKGRFAPPRFCVGRGEKRRVFSEAYLHLNRGKRRGGKKKKERPFPFVPENAGEISGRGRGGKEGLGVIFTLKPWGGGRGKEKG